jgi:hypothetical protein
MAQVVHISNSDLVTDSLFQLVSWIDSELVTQAVMDVAFTSLTGSENLPTALNLVHPRPVSWNFAMRSIRDLLMQERYGSKHMSLVEFTEWFKKLEACEAGSDVEENLVRAYSGYSWSY